MTLRQTTRDIIARVERVSGLPVQVLQDATLPTLASVQMARGNTAAHIVTYKPATREAPPDFVRDALALAGGSCPGWAACCSRAMGRRDTIVIKDSEMSVA